MKRILPRLLAVVCAAGTMAGAQAADLLGLYRDASTYDAQYASARAALNAGRQKLPQGRAGLLPTIGLSASTTHNDIDMQSRSSPPVDAPLKYNSNGWSLSLTQPLFRWQNWTSYKQAELAVAIAETQYVQARQDLILRVAQAYFDVLLAEESLQTAQAQKKAIAEQLASAQRNFEVGTATVVDTHEAQSRYDLTTAQELVADNDLLVKRQTLNQLVGKDVGLLKALRANVQLGRPQPDDINKWVVAAEKDALSVQIGQANLESANREVEKQGAGHYPTLDLVATHGRNSKGNSNSAPTVSGSDSDSTTIGLQLAIPIYAGGAVTAKEEEAIALQEKAGADLDNARRSASLAARTAYLGVASGLAQVKALEQALASTQVSLDSNRLAYDVGVRINIDVLNAQQTLYSTRRDLAKARLDTLMAQLKLKAAAGSLSEEDLVAVNGLLD